MMWALTWNVFCKRRNCVIYRRRFCYFSERAISFAKAIADGTDVALNDLNHYLDLRVPLDLVTAFKYALNLACDRKI